MFKQNYFSVNIPTGFGVLFVCLFVCGVVLMNDEGGDYECLALLLEREIRKTATARLLFAVVPNKILNFHRICLSLNSK